MRQATNPPGTAGQMLYTDGTITPFWGPAPAGGGGGITNLNGNQFNVNSSVGVIKDGAGLTNLQAHHSLTLTRISGPAAAPGLANGAAGVLNGAYGYAYTFVTAHGETDKSPSDFAVPSSQRVTVTIGVGPAGTTARKIYRTLDGGSDYFLVTTVADNTTTTYSDNTADGSLGAAAPVDNTAGGFIYLNGTPILHVATNGQAGGNLRLGYLAGTSNTVGSLSTIVGTLAGLHGTNLNAVTLFGKEVLYHAPAAESVAAFGEFAFWSATNLEYSAGLGTDLFRDMLRGYGITGVGQDAMENLLYGTNIIAGGYHAGDNIAGSAYNIVLLSPNSKFTYPDAHDAVGIGHGVRIHTNNIAVIGGGDIASALTDFYLGLGFTNTVTTNVTLHAPSGMGANVAAGQSTGSGPPGGIVLSTATAGGSGSTLNALVERTRIDSAGVSNSAAVYNASHQTTYGPVTNKSSVEFEHGASGTTVITSAKDGGRVVYINNTDGTAGSGTTNLVIEHADSGANVILASLIADGNVGYELGSTTMTVGGTVTSVVLPNKAISYPEMQDVSAASRLLGRGSAAGAGAPEELTAGLGLEFSGTAFRVAHNTSTQRVDVAKNSGATTGSRKRLNFIEGAGMTITVADDAGNDEVDVTLASSGGGSANYINQPVTNATLVSVAGASTTTNVFSGNAPTDGSQSTWMRFNTHSNQDIFTFGIGYVKAANIGSSRSNMAAGIGWFNPVAMDPGTNMGGGIVHEAWYRPNAGQPAQQEWYLRFDGTNGTSQDRRPLMFEWKEDGNYAGPFLRGSVTVQNMAATTNWLAFNDNFQHSMVANIFSFNGPESGRGEFRFRQRGTAAFFNTDNSLSWAITGHPNENGLALYGNEAGATNVIVTNFNSAPMIFSVPRGGIEVGPSSATLTNFLTATASLDFPSTLSCTNSDLPITVTGTTTNDVAQLGIPFQLGNTPGASFNAFCSNNTVWVRFINNRTNAAVDPVAAVVRALVTKVR
jgi:hypothetical protein